MRPPQFGQCDGLLGLAALAWFIASPPPCVAQSNPNAEPASQVQQGEYLARAGDCIACHTAPTGRPFAGGRAMPTPFGTLYSTNITPDPETGIGHWSEAAFARAMHEGVARDGSHLFLPSRSITLRGLRTRT